MFYYTHLSSNYKKQKQQNLQIKKTHANIKNTCAWHTHSFIISLFKFSKISWNALGNNHTNTHTHTHTHTQSLSLSLSLLLVVDFLEDVFEATIVSLENGVLGAHVERPALHECVLETGVSKTSDGLQTNTANVRN